MRTDDSEGGRIARLSAVLAGFSGKRILVIGDLMLDEYIWGKVSRISPEAPVPVVDVTRESYYPGGAANVARNLREFTDHVAVMGSVGADGPGQRLLELLAASGIDTSAVQQRPEFGTTVKTRIMARNQQVVRVDRERQDGPDLARACSDLDRVISAADAVIVADYGKGFLNEAMARAVCQTASDHSKILTIDPHPRHLFTWSGTTAIKPNRAEAFQAAGLPPSEPVADVIEDSRLLEAGSRLLERWNCGCLLITLGEQGMLLLERDAEPYPIPAQAREVFDVSGAGDTAIAVFTLGLAAGATPPEAAELANVASAVVVGKVGTATVTPAELQGTLY
jgi:D-beta-D-heptose 7-phosphate kinase/D-beta-D-heptose 1-phosphate adenosyltransferase